MDISQKTKNRTVVGSSSPIPWYTSKEIRSMNKGHSHACYTARLCTTVRRITSPAACQPSNGQIKYGTSYNVVLMLTKGKIKFKFCHLKQSE